jgi:hypothetical protein
MVMTLIVAGVALPIALTLLVVLIKTIRVVHEDSRRDDEIRDYLGSSIQKRRAAKTVD